MADYRDYVTFEPSESGVIALEDQDVRIKDLAVPDDVKKDVKVALEQIASTPEGAELLEKTASLSEGGKVQILYAEEATTHAIAPDTVPHAVLIGGQDSGAMYYSPETNDFCNISLQRMLHHELTHLVKEHYGLPEHEQEATFETNGFMKKYYNEPERDINQTNDHADGAKGWQLNENFNLPNPDAGLDQTMAGLAGMSAEKAASLSPEAQSLYELRNHPRNMLEAQYAELQEGGGIAIVETDLSNIEPALEPAPAQNLSNDDPKVSEPSRTITPSLG